MGWLHNDSMSSYQDGFSYSGDHDTAQQGKQAPAHFQKERFNPKSYSVPLVQPHFPNKTNYLVLRQISKQQPDYPTCRILLPPAGRKGAASGPSSRGAQDLAIQPRHRHHHGSEGTYLPAAAVRPQSTYTSSPISVNTKCTYDLRVPQELPILRMHRNPNQPPQNCFRRGPAPQGAALELLSSTGDHIPYRSACPPCRKASSQVRSAGCTWGFLLPPQCKVAGSH